MINNFGHMNETFYNNLSQEIRWQYFIVEEAGIR